MSTRKRQVFSAEFKREAVARLGKDDKDVAHASPASIAGMGSGTDRAIINNIREDATRGIAGQCSGARCRSGKFQEPGGDIEKIPGWRQPVKTGIGDISDFNYWLDYRGLAVYSSYTLFAVP